MSKRLLPVLVLLATAALAGCGDDSSDSGADSAPTTEATESTESAEVTESGSPTEPAAGGATCSYPEDEAPASKEVDLPPEQASVSGQVPATMETTLGDFELTLDADNAPCTVNSFVSLAEQGYFDETTCHRLTTVDESGIAVLQCGDPTGTGSGGPGYVFDDELTGTETYTAGTLAMANRGANTNGSQFFIVYGDTPLSPDYTVFGTVDAATVDAISTLAEQGTVPAEGGMTAPAEPVDVSAVTVG